MALGARSRSQSEVPPPPTGIQQLEALGAIGPRPDLPATNEAMPPASAEIRLQKPALPALALVLFILALVASVPILYYLFYAILALVIITFIWTRALVQNVGVHRVLRTKWC